MDLFPLIGAFVIFMEALLGILFSGFIIYLYFSGTSENTSFSLICLSRAINNVYVLVLNFLVLSFPLILFSKHVLPISIEALIVPSTINIYIVNEYHCVLICFNRFIAMFAPMYYSRLCSVKVTMAVLGIFYLERIYASISIIYRMFDKNCLATLSLDYFGLMYEYPNCNKDMKNGLDSPLVVLGPLAAFVFTIVLNLITFGKIMHFYMGNKSMDSENLVAVKNNIRLFFQTVLQDSLFFVDMLFTFKLSELSDGRVWALISQMLVWESIHMLDGFIMLMFSNRLSILKSKIFKSNQNNVDRRMFQIGRSSNTLPEIA